MNPLRLGIFSGLKQLKDEREQRRRVEEDRALRLEDRVRVKEMHDLQKRSLEQSLATPRSSQVQWDTKETENGLVQIHPVTGEVRPVTLEGAILRPPARPKAESWQVDPERGVRINRETGAVAPIQGLPPRPASTADKDRDAARRVTVTTKLRDDFRNEAPVKSAYELSRVAGGIKAGLAGQTPMDDLSLIYETVKLFDPNSVVREGEIKLMQSAASLPLQLRLMVDRWNSGRLLTPGMRAHISALVDRKLAESEQSVQPIQADYGKQVREFGFEGDSSFVAPSPFRGVQRTKRAQLPNQD